MVAVKHSETPHIGNHDAVLLLIFFPSLISRKVCNSIVFFFLNKYIERVILFLITMKVSSQGWIVVGRVFLVVAVVTVCWVEFYGISWQTPLSASSSFPSKVEMSAIGWELHNFFQVKIFNFTACSS